MEGSPAGVRTAPQWLHSRAWYLAANMGLQFFRKKSASSKEGMLCLLSLHIFAHFLIESNIIYIYIYYMHKICPEASRYLQRGFLHLPSVLVLLRQI